MINKKQRSLFLSSLYNFKRLTSVFVKSRKELKNAVEMAIEDYRKEASYIPNYMGNGITLESITKEKQYEWMLEVDMAMYHELLKTKTPEQIVDDFYSSALNAGLNLLDISPETKDHPMARKPLMALDLETTGLDLTVLKEGGKPYHVTYITGICLAYLGEDLKEHSIYIPVMHTESDGVPNLLYKKAIELLTNIVNNFSPIYHNSSYDREASSLNGVTIADIGGFFDTMIIVKQTEYMLQEHPKIGLKELSEELLDRPQIHLNDLDAKNKGFHNLSYSEMNIYGNCDSSNTLALFRYFVENNPDLFKTMTLHSIDAKAIDCTSVFNRRGFPANKDYMLNALTDTLRRVSLIQDKFQQIQTELDFDEEHHISKTQAVSRELINIYINNFKAFVKKKTNIDIDIWGDSDDMQRFITAVQEDLDIVIKKEVLVSGLIKLTHSMDVGHLEGLQNDIESIRWMNPRQSEKIAEMCGIMLEVSSVLQNMNTYYTPFLDGLTYDDTGYYKLPVHLKFASTITTRYANAKGKPSRLYVQEMKTKTKYPLVLNNGLSGVNAQGLPSGQYNIVKAKRITDIDSLGKKVALELKRKESEIQDDLYFKLMS